MDKNISEKEKLYKWACQYTSKDRTESVFTPVMKECSSYYESIKNTDYIHEYNFDTVNEIKQELSSLWKEDEIFGQAALICSVACMKNKNILSPQKKDAHENMKQLKPYIYHF